MATPSSLFDLTGKVAIVTGASSGLGVQFAEALADAGAHVALAARRADRLETLADRLGKGGCRAVGIVCDVTQEAEVQNLVDETLQHFGHIDILVNNAGITQVIAAEAQTIADFDQQLAVNLRGVFLCAQRVGRVMLEAGGGTIVNVASTLGMVASGQVPQAAYAASKGGVINLTRELAAQWARRGVRVNALAPGWFESEMTEEMFGDERSEKWMRTRTPMGRAGHQGELAGALLLLASDASSFITGAVLPVDGGWTIV